MIIAVGISASRGTVRASVLEICEAYQLSLVEDSILLFPHDAKAIFVVSCEHRSDVELLEGDPQVEGVWHDPELISLVPRRTEMVDRLNNLFNES